MPDFTIPAADVSKVAEALTRDAELREHDGLFEMAATQYRIASGMWRELGYHGRAARFASRAMQLRDRIEAGQRKTVAAACVDWLA